MNSPEVLIFYEEDPENNLWGPTRSWRPMKKIQPRAIRMYFYHQRVFFKIRLQGEVVSEDLVLVGWIVWSPTPQPLALETGGRQLQIGPKVVPLMMTINLHLMI